MMLLETVQNFLDEALEGKVKITPQLREEFMENCGAILDKQFGPRQEWRLRMSSVGQKPCKQHLQKDGLKERMDYSTFMRFIFGDMIETLAITIMKAAGIDVQDEQKGVSLEVAGVKLSGSMDCTIFGKVWDVKSASPYSFSDKFGQYGGYTKIKKDDPFGYITQGFCYSKADDKPLGGWIAINKSTGEWAFTEAPEYQDEESREALQKAEDNINEILKGKYERLPDEPEVYTLKKVKYESGNRMLGKDCQFCGFKWHCWPDAVLAPKATSAAKNPPLTWYSELPYPKVEK